MVIRARMWPKGTQFNNRLMQIVIKKETEYLVLNGYVDDNELGSLVNLIISTGSFIEEMPDEGNRKQFLAGLNIWCEAKENMWMYRNACFFTTILNDWIEEEKNSSKSDK